MMDLQIIWDLFTNGIDAASVLGVDEKWVNQMKEAKESFTSIKNWCKGSITRMVD